MKSIRKTAKTAALLFVAVLLVVQVFRIEKSNPPVRSDIAAGPELEPLLRRACYNCHSNETVWPWYSNVAPVSWLVGNDVKEARHHLNFSEWGVYSTDDQRLKLKAIGEEVGEGGMPLWYYSLIHADSRLTEAERDKIKEWTATAKKAQ
jgi:hypothetical protein